MGPATPGPRPTLLCPPAPARGGSRQVSTLTGFPSVLTHNAPGTQPAPGHGGRRRRGPPGLGLGDEQPFQSRLRRGCARGPSRESPLSLGPPLLGSGALRPGALSPEAGPRFSASFPPFLPLCPPPLPFFPSPSTPPPRQVGDTCLLGSQLGLGGSHKSRRHLWALRAGAGRGLRWPGGAVTAALSGRAAHPVSQVIRSLGYSGWGWALRP